MGGSGQQLSLGFIALCFFRTGSLWSDVQQFTSDVVLD